MNALAPPADPNANPVQAPLSGNLIDGLLADGWHWASSSPGPVTLSYVFDQSADYENAGATRAWVDFEKDAYVAALGAWANVANVAFVESPTEAGANFHEFLVSATQMDTLVGGAS